MQRHVYRRLVAVLAAAALSVPLTASVGSVAAAAPTIDARAAGAKPATDDRADPTELKRRELRKSALADVLKGKAKPMKRGASTVVKVGKKPAAKRAGARSAAGTVDQYVELGREKTDRIFVVLAEFGDERAPDYPDQDTDPDTPGPTTFNGPLHNRIPEPDRSKDNTTNWDSDYSQKHFQDLYFSQDPGVNSVANYYDKQSSGRYTVQGQVTDWVKVRYNEARYGRSDGYPCDSNVCNNSYDLIKDAVNQWVAEQKAKGQTTEQIKADLAQFDRWDRNDYDGDGDFNEPDGYIDHFQIVHAGGDQADGDPQQGEDAIWSHRGYAYHNFTSGPGQNLQGGTQIGDTGLWVGDYTMQPENGGVSVFAHEFAHDLGLPDEYDTSYGGTNNVNWWSLMAQNRVNGLNEPIGYRAPDMAAWDKLQLGWLDYEVVPPGVARTLELGPHEYNSAKAQGVVVPLPDLTKTVDYGAPASGSKMWWSDSGDNLDNKMSREVDLTGKKAASLDLKARYDIETDFDYLYVEASTDGVHWAPLNGTVGGKPFVKDSNGAPAVSGSSAGKWVDMSVPLNAYAGKKVTVRFEYFTDGGFAPMGFFGDDITVHADGAAIFSDGAENGANGWTLKGFRAVGQKETKQFDNFYVASNRTYQSYDQYMKTGPYNYGFRPDRPDWVEHFPYQTGLLVSYWNTAYNDNNTSAHLGAGEILPIDAHPQPIYNLDGKPWGPTIGGYDVPFSLRKADSFTLHNAGKASYIRGQAGNPTFDDTKSYYAEAQPTAGVTLPGVGVGMKVLQENGTSMKVKIYNTKK